MGETTTYESHPMFHDTHILHSHLYGAAGDSLGQDHDEADVTAISGNICTSCGKDRHCLAYRASEDADVRLGVGRLITAMRVIGVLHVKRNDSRFSPSHIYSCLVCLLQWLNFLGFFYMYRSAWSFGSRLFYRVTLHIWYGQVAIISSVFLLQVSKQLPDFLDTWNRFAYRNHCATAEKVQQTSKYAQLMACLAVLVSIMAGITTGYFVESKEPSPVQHLLSSLLGTSSPASTVIIRISLLVYPCLYFFIWMQPIAFFYTLCVGIQFNFSRLACMLRSVLASPQSPHLSNDLNRIKGSHQELCRIVKSLDNIFSFVTFVVYVTCIPLMCLAFYNIAFNISEGVTQIVVVAIVHLCVVMGQLAVITGSGSQITSAAKLPTEDLFDFYLSDSVHDSTTVAFQISIFIQRVTKCHIGLTAWNLFNVNKQTIFTVTTMILTYMFVLFKLGISLEKSGHQGGEL